MELADTVPNAVGAVALFSGTGGSPAVVDTAITIGVLQYTSTASYDIQNSGGSVLTLQNTGSTAAQITMPATTTLQKVSAPVRLAGDLVVTNSSNKALTMSGNISESGGSRSVTLASGLLVLSGTGNSWTGSTNVNGGTLQMGGANAAAPASTMVLSPGATVDLNSYSQVIGGLSGTGGTVSSSRRGHADDQPDRQLHFQRRDQGRHRPRCERRRAVAGAPRLGGECAWSRHLCG